MSTLIGFEENNHKNTTEEDDLKDRSIKKVKDGDIVNFSMPSLPLADGNTDARRKVIGETSTYKEMVTGRKNMMINDNMEEEDDIVYEH